MSVRLSRLSGFINRVQPQWTASTLRLRGLAIPAEPFLRGTPRFAKLTGSFMPVVSADNTMVLTAAARRNDSGIAVDAVLKWIQPGCLVQLEGREVATVLDVNVVGGFISLESPLLDSHDAGVQVTLHGVGVSLDGLAAKGATVFLISTLLDVMVGDELLVDTVRYDVLASDNLNTNPITGVKVWQVTVGAALHRALPDQSTIFLRGHPGYLRKSCPIPSIPALAGIMTGPLVLDRVSGTLKGSTVFPEYCSITQLGGGFNQIVPPTTIPKNFVAARGSIPSDSLLFWDLAEGLLNWDGNRTAGFFDDTGHFRIVQRLEPPIPAGQLTTWRVSVFPVTPVGSPPVKINFICEPGAPQTFTLINNQDNTLNVQLPNQDMVRIQIAAVGPPGAHVSIGPLNVVGSQVKALTYSIVCRTDGAFRWASSGLIIKPMMLNLSYVRTRFDRSSFDSGSLMIP